MEQNHNKRSRELFNKRKRRSTKKLIDKLVNKKFQGKNGREYRKKFKKHAGQQKDITIIQPLMGNLKFGAINIDGLDLKNCVEIERFILERDFDVSNIRYIELPVDLKILSPMVKNPPKKT